jgi:NADH:ubiquinone oxidoreductase subunit 6 (subunit J)
MRDRSIRSYALAARLLLAALAIAGLNLLLASTLGLTPILVNAVAIGGIGLAVVALPPAADRHARESDAEPVSVALARL